MLLICVFNNQWIFNQYILFSKKILFLWINPFLIQNFSCPKKFCHHRHAVWQGIYYFPLIDGSLFATPSEDVRYLLRTRWRFVLKDRRLSINYKRKYDFMKRTLIQCLHRTCSSTHARQKHKRQPLSSWRYRCPATFEGMY